MQQQEVASKVGHTETTSVDVQQYEVASKVGHTDLHQ